MLDECTMSNKHPVKCHLDIALHTKHISVSVLFFFYYSLGENIVAVKDLSMAKLFFSIDSMTIVILNKNIISPDT